MKAGIALGSNLGDRMASLRRARAQIATLKNVRPPVVSSLIYETEPVGCEEGAPKFLNAVIECEYSGGPGELLGELEGIECLLGRPVAHPRNASRPIDLDLLYFGPMEVETPELHLPHPRSIQREFVLRPLADINPGLILPRQTKSVGALVLQFSRSDAVVRFAEQW